MDFQGAGIDTDQVHARESATYPWPYSNVCDRSMTAASRLTPWLLWMVSAHASRRGSCVIFASTISPSAIVHSIGSTSIPSPSLLSTIGYLLSALKPTTVPSVPLTHPRFELYR